MLLKIDFEIYFHFEFAISSEKFLDFSLSVPNLNLILKFCLPSGEIVYLYFAKLFKIFR